MSVFGTINPIIMGFLCLPLIKFTDDYLRCTEEVIITSFVHSMEDENSLLYPVNLLFYTRTGSKISLLITYRWNSATREFVISTLIFF